MTDTTFETLLSGQLREYAEAGVRPIDRFAIAEETIAVGRTVPRWRRGWGFAPMRGTRVLVPLLVGLLLAALVGGALLVGSRLLDRRPDAETPQQPAVVAPSAEPSAGPSAAPVAEPSVEPTKQPSPSGRPPAEQPCPAMIRLAPDKARLFENPTDPIPAVGQVTGNGDVLVRTMPGAGAADIGRFDPSKSPPAPVGIIEGVELPFQSVAISASIDPAGRLVASPDGRAVAFEAGDFGQAGCGDPIVVPAGNGYRRPFLGRAFEFVSDLAWAPDGSALYGIRRPTLDALGQPYTASLALGTVIRWDTATGEVTELPAGCEDCSRIFVSPDGTHIAAESAGAIKIYDAGGGWRDLIGGYDLAGWADDESVVVNDDGAGRRVTLDGRVAAQWDAPCCHFSFHGPLSPDGTMIAGMTTSSDFLHKSVTLFDTRDGSTRTIWSAPDVRGCDAFGEGSTGRADCLAGPHPTPGSPDAISGYARIAAWAPDGSAVLLLDQSLDTTTTTLQVVSVDGSGAGSKVTVEHPALSGTLDWSPSIVWLPDTAP